VRVFLHKGCFLIRRGVVVPAVRQTRPMLAAAYQVTFLGMFAWSNGKGRGSAWKMDSAIGVSIEKGLPDQKKQTQRDRKASK